MRKASGKSIVDVGRLAGVSFSTAARALRNDPRITRETANKVFKAAYQVGYIQKQKNAHPVIGILMPVEERTFYIADTFSALTKEILSREWLFDTIPVTFIKQQLRDQYLSGVVNILQGDDVAWNTNYLQPLITYQPHTPYMDNVYSVAEDGAHNLGMCVDYLWGLGHRKIGLLLNHSKEEEQKTMEQRVKAFLYSMDKRGAVRPEENVFFNRDGSLSSRIDRLLKNRVTAVIVIADRLGLQVYRDLLKRGLRIPQDISLLTWEIPYVSENLYPAITAMQQNYADWAKTVCDLFESIWSGKKVEHSIYVPGKLIIRESCASVDPEQIRKKQSLRRKKGKGNAHFH